MIRKTRADPDDLEFDPKKINILAMEPNLAVKSDLNGKNYIKIKPINTKIMKKYIRK